MISICRICLNNISGEDMKSRRLIDFHSYYKPQKGICNITFFDVVSSCLPNMNLNIPIDGIPRVCGSCCSKIVGLFTLKQQSFEIEKLLLQFVQFQNSFDNCVNKPIKLADVASMYGSVFKNQYTRVVVVDLLKQLHSACKQQDASIEPSENENRISYESNILNTEEFNSIISNNKDAMILVVEKNVDNMNPVLKEDVHLHVAKNSRDNTEINDLMHKRNSMTAETWFKMSQTNLLPTEHRKGEIQKAVNLPMNEQISPNTTKNCQKSCNNLQETCILPNQEISPNNDIGAECLVTNEPENEVLNEKNPTSYNGQDLQHEECTKMWNVSSKRSFARISSTNISDFVKEFKTAKQKDKTISELRSKNKTKSFLNGSKTNIKESLNNNINISENGSLNNDVENKILNEASSKASLDKINQDASTEAIIKEAEEEIENEIFSSDLDMNELTNKTNSGSNVTYQCKICEIHFLNENEYQVHLCCTTTVQCEVCNVLFENVERWKQHICTESSDHLNSQINTHSIQNSQEKLFKSVFIKQSDFDDQLDLHLTQSPMDVITDNYTCEICDMDFFTKTDLTDHVAASHVSITDKYTSKIQEEINPNAQQMSLTQTSDLKEASPPKPEVNLFLSPGEDNEQKFKCNKCPLTFGNENLLSLHMNEHLNLFRKDLYKCDKCDKQFQYAHLLRRHKNVHSPRECLICGQSFALSHNLHAHILLHTSTPPTDCERESTNADSLSITTTPLNANAYPLEINTAALSSRSHQSPVDQANFNSIQCGESYKDKYELECHAEDHMIDIKFECDICYDVFPSRPAYRMHKNTNCPGDLLKHEIVIHNDQNSIINDDNDAESLEPVRRRIGNTVFTKRKASTELYQCRLCPKKFISQKFIMNHFRTHKKKPPALHHCKNCGIGFAKINILRKHVAIKHPVDRQDLSDQGISD